MSALRQLMGTSFRDDTPRAEDMTIVVGSEDEVEEDKVEEDEVEEDKVEEDEVEEDEVPKDRCRELDHLIQGIQENITREFKMMNASFLAATEHRVDQVPDMVPDPFGSQTSTPRKACSVTNESIITDFSDKKRRFDRAVYDEDREDMTEDSKGWSKHKKHRLRFCVWRLKYNRVVTQFYLNELRKSEEYWSWMIIMVSTLTSGITVANNVDEEFIPNYHIYINVLLNVSSMTTSLIAAWIKKKKFVESINEIDKYLLGINKLCEELEVRMALLETDRMDYHEFKTTFLPQIIQYATSNPMIPPEIWKRCVKDITLNYPELVDPDSSEANKLWPWFGDLVEHQDGDDVYHIRKPTSFMKHMKKTNTDRILSSCCRKKRDCDNVYK